MSRSPEHCLRAIYAPIRHGRQQRLECRLARAGRLSGRSAAARLPIAIAMIDWHDMDQWPSCPDQRNQPVTYSYVRRPIAAWRRADDRRWSGTRDATLGAAPPEPGLVVGRDAAGNVAIAVGLTARSGSRLSGRRLGDSNPPFALPTAPGASGTCGTTGHSYACVLKLSVAVVPCCGWSALSAQWCRHIVLPHLPAPAIDGRHQSE
jgi:hypothetical protein